MKWVACNQRRGMTLLELMLATAMMATIVTAVSVVLRTGYTTWLAQEADYERALYLAGAGVRGGTCGYCGSTRTVPVTGTTTIFQVRCGPATVTSYGLRAEPSKVNSSSL